MTTRTVPDLKELFKQASEIAQQVPPNMQEAAFNRALDLLTGGSGGSTEQTGLRTSDVPPQENLTRPIKSRGAPTAKRIPRESTNQLDALLLALDSTQHPGIVSAPKILDRALMVLKIALDEQDIDGLSAGDIARVLREKFRVSVSEPAVRMALSRAASLVDRVKNGTGYNYRIMAPGSKYLAGLNASEVVAPARAAARKRKRKAATPKANAKGAVAIKEPSLSKAKNLKAKSPSTPQSTSSSLGPKAAVLALLEDGFFSSPRTGLAVREYLKTKRGYTIAPDQLRVAMLRLVRELKLDREENASGDYEYKRA